MLLILSEYTDEHVPLLLPKLEERGATYLWFDPASFPSTAHISVGVNHGGITHRLLCYHGREYDLSTVTAVWHRRPGKPTAASAVREETHRTFVELVSQRYLEGLWATLDCQWLPSTPAVDRMADNKLVQLALAAQLGFLVYPTLVTNDPQAYLDFYATCNAHLVSKSLVNTEVKRDGEAHVVVYTHPVRRRDASNFRSIQYAPVIFQAYIPKQVEVRVTVVGTRVFAAEIASQESNLTRHDWRHYEDPRVRYEVHTLPHHMETRCVQLVERLGLCYGAIDLILTPADEYVFLEINPNGQWGFIELATGLPIASTIADLLTGHRAEGANDE